MLTRFLVLLALIGVSSVAAAEVGRARTNVLFIIADDLNTDLGCYGHPQVKSPNIDRLAQRGVRFEHAYCQYPVCGPSRSSFLLGLRPNVTRILANIGRNAAGVYGTSPNTRETQPDAVTLPQLFRQNGSWTGRIGKIFHYGVPGQIGTPGLDDPFSWDVVVNPLGRDKKEEASVFSLRMDVPIAERFGGTVSWKQMDGSELEQTDGIGATEAIKLLETHRDRPFFLAVGFFRPHTPYVATKKYYDLYPRDQIPLPALPAHHIEDGPVAAFASLSPEEKKMTDTQRREAIQGYHAAVSMVDAQVGRLLDALDRLGLADNTVVVFTSDHGYHLGEHGLWQKNTLWENAARVPLIIAVPGSRYKGETARGLVEMLDLYPTLADLVGLTAPANLQGLSLRPILQDPKATVKSAAFSQVLRGGYSGYAVRTERFRYTEWDGGRSGVQLFDLEADPGELKNLATDPAQAANVAELKALIAKNWPPGIWTPESEKGGADKGKGGKK